jgi:hypothetical protein
VEYPQIYNYQGAKGDPNHVKDQAFLCAAFVDEESVLVTPAEWKGQLKKEVVQRRVLKQHPYFKELLEDIPPGQHNHIYDAAGLVMYHLKGSKL